MASPFVISDDEDFQTVKRSRHKKEKTKALSKGKGKQIQGKNFRLLAMKQQDSPIEACSDDESLDFLDSLAKLEKTGPASAASSDSNDDLSLQCLLDEKNREEGSFTSVKTKGSPVNELGIIGPFDENTALISPPCRLDNPGANNICFFNCVIQVLWSLKQFREYFLHCHEGSWLKNIFLLLRNNVSTNLNLTDILHQHSKTWLKEYRPGQQVDAAECLVKLLDYFRPAHNLSVLIETTLTCDCNKSQTVTSLEPGTYLHVENLKESTVSRVSGLLDLLQGIENVEPVEWKCGCEKPLAKSQYIYHRVKSIEGDTLVINLNLFKKSYRNNRYYESKLNPSISIPHHLKFHGNWRLKAMIHHLGRDAMGHYTCMVRGVGDIWFHCDDSKISAINLSSEDVVCDKKPGATPVPYVIVYERDSGAPLSNPPRESTEGFDSDPCEVMCESESRDSGAPSNCPNDSIELIPSSEPCEEEVVEITEPPIVVSNSDQHLHPSPISSPHGNVESEVDIQQPDFRQAYLDFLFAADSDDNDTDLDNMKDVEYGSQSDSNVPNVFPDVVIPDVVLPDVVIPDDSTKLESDSDNECPSPNLNSQPQSVMVNQFSEVEGCISNYEYSTGSEYVIRSKSKSFGEFLSHENHHVRWKDMNNVDEAYRIEFTGTPFMQIGLLKYDCKHGPDHHKPLKARNKKRKLDAKNAESYAQCDNLDLCHKKSYRIYQQSRKEGCSSRISVRHLVFFLILNLLMTSGIKKRHE